MYTELEIEELFNEINEYQKINGEDKDCLLAKAKLFDIIGENNMAIDALKKALEFDKKDTELLYSLAVEYEKVGYLSLSSVYYALAALEMKKCGQISEYNEIINSMNSASVECREIFDTVLKDSNKTFVFLSICGFGEAKQRYQNLACALSFVAEKVIYVCPKTVVSLNQKVSDEQLADYVLSNTEYKEGVYIVQPFIDLNYGIDSYNCIVEKLANNYRNSVFVVSNVDAFEAATALKGKNKIIFDCADDNSDYKNAFWSNPDLYRQEQKLMRMADDVTCTSVSLFLKKALIENHNSVYLSPNAVSDYELDYNTKDFDIPEDIKDIPHPIVGYVGVIYKRFDRDLFYDLVKNNPDKSFVIVGSVMDNYIEKKYENMYFFGTKKHSELGKYYRNMDICIIPYFDDAKMSMSCDPVKIHEHICCNVPTIVTYMPDTAIDRPMVYHANTSEGFQKHIDDILSDKPSIDKKELDNYIAKNSWISRACHLIRIADENIYEYEKQNNKIHQIIEKYNLIKDDHPNFGVIYGLASWNENITESKKYIEKAANDYKTDFNTELLEIFNQRKLTFKNNLLVKIENVSCVSKEKCVGCLSCASVCTQGAIEVKKNELGFSYPIINNKCISCGRCIEHCPIENPKYIGRSSVECFAAMANDDIRKKSSSGGVFPLLAKTVWAEGGYVAGAVFDKTFHHLKHIVSNDIFEIEKMFESKYLESNMLGVYDEVKSKLENGNVVLFSGCPCQVAGLYSYLGKKYENLISVSLVCHGVPSPEFYRQHIDYISGDNKLIKKVSFRDKEKLGWNTGLCIDYYDNNSYVRNSINDNYIEGFLADLYLRDSCYNCNFKNDLYSDIVLGDFWGIENVMNTNDNLGVSYISVNTEKGEEYLGKCAFKYIILYRTNKRKTILSNRSIRSTAKKPLLREKLLRNFADSNFEEAYKNTFDSEKFNIALILWYSNNYGNALTNYALYKSLTQNDFNVLAIDNLAVSPLNQFDTFAKKYFITSSKLFPRNYYRHIINCCDNFMVGSDQVWNKTFSYVMHDNGYFQLSFIPDEKNKISYGSSFGQTSDAVEFDKKDYYKELYKRIDHVSTREKFGVKVLKELFDVDSTYVLDPVFLLKKEQYHELALCSELNDDYRDISYIAAYILTPDDNKISYLEKLRKKYHYSKVVVIIDAEPSRAESNISYFKNTDFEIKTNLNPEDFISIFENSSYVVTDSYHGTCFSIIFEKLFTAIINRESERFETFREFPEISDRIMNTAPKQISNNENRKIDYISIGEKIKTMREDSLEYIIDSLV